MEQVYLGWADFHLLKGNVRENLRYKYMEWIVLHSGDKFTSWVEFLKNEVNRAVVSQDYRSRFEESFLKALSLELDFFDSCYSYKE
ncbi:DEHA2F26972p [Debaryomyces hansenii CBS767]|jgi:thiaminase|uniref:DEHA2F26972p n=1 Tax=Debaryomyces hansenii (strain ATCC 36239 / CBS 767 / BCRC 21394 / JCM 1990 / NBRC 0083 / IGC 2968) TaxID=284592 RepID=Q6BJW0_DEBHA|nr:DEHA2F26972p [Debaryomyces hansenii CBS767]CAG89939.1 DEHA2F26972p [Debaryomyces hansenii CBS767]|eukprot:XP_461511.1 DEHA2F26972p [Debaryomyces hansenii CBS767]